MLASSFQRFSFVRSKMRQASATHRINKDVQLEDKKSECGHGPSWNASCSFAARCG
jgi:hypothetical protein